MSDGGVAVPVERPVADGLTDFARQLQRRSRGRFGPRREVEMVGVSPAMVELQRKIAKVAPFDEPVLITGESGVGKELVARAIYLVGPRSSGPFESVNCPQHLDGNLTVSELFGHERGSFTGAVSERIGCFEAAAGGVVFLDEVADLHMSAQVMLLRTLAEGEFKRIGSNRSRYMDIRLVAATNRSLDGLMAREEFRNDLFFRLRYFQIEVPPLRRRGDDWRLLMDYQLARAAQRYGVVKQMSAASLRLLEQYDWPGNCRELNNVVSMGYALSDSDVIEPEDFEELLEGGPRRRQGEPHSLFQALIAHRCDFWDGVQRPFLDRDLNRAQVRDLILEGLKVTDGSYRKLLPRFGIADDDYQRFMDFLRHHRLKP